MGPSMVVKAKGISAEGIGNRKERRTDEVGVVGVSCQGKRCIRGVTFGQVRRELPEFTICKAEQTVCQLWSLEERELITLSFPNEPDSVRQLLRRFGCNRHTGDEGETKFVLYHKGKRQCKCPIM
jgi:hypothetical protein